MKKILILLLGLLLSTLVFSRDDETFTNSTDHSVAEDTTYHCFPLDVSSIGVIDDQYGVKKICVTIESQDDGDLIFFVQAPDGTRVWLSRYNGGDGDDYGVPGGMFGGGTPTCFLMTATTSVKDGVAPFDGDFIPEDDLALFNNFQDADGQWKLCIADVNGNNGSDVNFIKWSITFGENPPSNITRITTCDQDWFDLGGDGTDYSPGEEHYWVICSDDAAKKVGLDFSLWDVEDSTNSDRLTIWDTSLVYGSSLWSGDGLNDLENLIIRSTNDAGCLTLRWTSDNDTLVGEGWKAHISCYLDCQTVNYSWDGSTPNSDTNYIAVCQDQEITFNAHGVYPENGIRYSQDDASSTFLWDFGDGTSGFGTTVKHTYVGDPQGYEVNLAVVDNQGCRSTLSLDKRVMISMTPHFDGTKPADNSVCVNSCTSLLPQTQTYGWQQELVTSKADTVFLPDGTGNSYESDLLLNQFPPGATLDDVNDVVSICIDIEHSYFGDLEMAIRCPDGSVMKILKSSGTSGDYSPAILGNPVAKGLAVDTDTDDPDPGNPYKYCFTIGATQKMHSNSSCENIDYVDPKGRHSDDIYRILAGEYQVEEGSWSDLAACPLNGTWTFIVTDKQGSDNGYLFGWSILFDSTLYENGWKYSTDIKDSVWTGSDVTDGSDGTKAKACVQSVGDNVYTYTVTDQFGCSYDTTVTITGTGVDYDLTKVDIKCKGQTTGSAKATVTAGTATEYEWKKDGIVMSGESGNEITNLSAGDYTVAVKNAEGCTNIKTITITEPNTNVSATATPTDPQCHSGSDGTIKLTPAGGTPGTPAYTYHWATGETTKDLSGLSKGSYKVTVKDGNDCPFTLTVDLDEPSAVTANATPTDANCNGSKDGSIDLVISGGTPSATAPPYTTVWSNGASFTSTDEDISDLYAETYKVQIKDAHDCPITISGIVVGEPSAITMSEDDKTNSDCGAKGGTADLTVANGSPAYSYTWTNISTGNVLPAGDVSDQNLIDVAAGNYRLVVTDSHGCLDSLDVSITDKNAPTSSLKDTIHNSCYGDHSGSVTVAVTGGTGSMHYDWDNDGIGDNDDAATLTGLAAGTYNVTVVDDGNCKTTESFTVKQPKELIVNLEGVDSVNCNGDANGKILISVVDGTPNYSYKWTYPDGHTSTNELFINDAPVGTYKVEVTDDSSCVKSIINIEVKEPTAIVMTSTIDSVKCNGGSTGGIDVEVTGGIVSYTYDWDTDEADDYDDTQDLSNLSVGTYSVTVKDHNGCTKELTNLEVKEPTAIVMNSSVDSVECNGGATGSIDVEVTGGVVSYTYDWDGDGFDDTQDLSGLSAGTYSVTVKDHNGCTKEITNLEVKEPVPFDNSATTEKANCGANDGTLTVTASGSNTGTYMYVWYAPDGTQLDSTSVATCDTLPFGTYTIKVVDRKSCTDVLQATVDENGAGTVKAKDLEQNVSCYGKKDATSTAIMTGGTPGYTYYWILGTDTVGEVSSTEATVLQSELGPGTYTVVVLDNNNCRSADEVIITQPDTLDLSTKGQNLKCYQDNTGATQIENVTGGTTPYTYQWKDASGNLVSSELSATGLEAGEYTFILSDKNACTYTTNVTIEEPTLLELETNVEKKATGGDLYATASGGTPEYTYLWSTGETDSVLLNQVVGTYSVIVTDANGCEQRSILTIEVPLEIPTIISPNGDGINDTWEILGIEAYADIHIEIYNRWGNIVFEFTGSGRDYGDAMNRFNGISTEGKELPFGSYVYILDLINEDLKYSGIVTIIREKE